MRSWCFLSNVSKKFQKEKAKYLKAIYPIPSKLIKRGSDEGKSILLKISVKRKKRKNNAKSLFLRLFPVFLAQRRGFEPPVGFRPTHDFQSCSLNHSDISAFYGLPLRKPFYITWFHKKTQVFLACFFNFFWKTYKSFQALPPTARNSSSGVSFFS